MLAYPLLHIGMGVAYFSVRICVGLMHSCTSRSVHSEAGFTLLDVVVSIGLIAVLSTLAVTQLKELDNPVKNASSGIIGYFKQVRARAISTTSAYSVSATSSGRIEAVYGKSCETTVTPDPKLILDLPTGAAISDISWSICFNGRGLPDSNIQITVSGESETRTLEVFLGGGVKEVTAP